MRGRSISTLPAGRNENAPLTPTRVLTKEKSFTLQLATLEQILLDAFMDYDASSFMIAAGVR